MSLINNALSGALAAQTALTTTSQNIANVATDGYTRQGALLKSVQFNGQTLSPGDGVAVPSLIRFSDSYKNMQMWQAASNLNEKSNVQPYLTQLEQIMGDDVSSINTGLDNFFSALNAASVEPTSSPLRQQVITSADSLGARFNSLRQVLSVQKQSLYQQRSALVNQVNQASADIASLNKQIAYSVATGTTPSGLLDQLNSKIDALAGMVGIQVIEQPDGTKDISLKGGQPLVVGALSSTLSAQMAASGAQTITLTFAKETFSLSDTGIGGSLGGLGDYYVNTLTPLTDSIVDMATNISTLFNNQLAAGFDMNGNSGAPLFVLDITSASSLLTINTALTAKDLAFSSSSTIQGNSDNLLSMINLKNQSVTVTSLGSVLLGDSYTQLVGKLGSDSQKNQASLNTAQTVRDQTISNWKTTSGVNSDEEAINLLQYQQMYQANMKVIGVANSLFDATLAMFN
jgi:flagellar hook-associated protein 1 FlgK